MDSVHPDLVDSCRESKEMCIDENVMQDMKFQMDNTKTEYILIATLQQPESYPTQSITLGAMSIEFVCEVY